MPIMKLLNHEEQASISIKYNHNENEIDESFVHKQEEIKHKSNF